MSYSPLPQQPRLTVAIHSHGDASLLPATLESVRDIADEIVIVESGATRPTAALASGYGARVVEHRWANNLSAAANAALAACRSSWILWLEPGEQLQAASRPSIRAFTMATHDRLKAFIVLIENSPTTAGAAVERVGKIRLLPNQPGIHFTGRACPALREWLAEAGIAVELSSWVVQMGRHTRELAFRRQRATRDLKLIEQDIAQSGPSAAVCVALGEIHTAIGQPESAHAAFRQALELSERGSIEMLDAYYGLLAAMDGDVQRGEQQVATCLEALEVFPLDAQLLCAMGGYLQAQGRHDLGCRSYQLAFDMGQVNPECWHLRDVAELAASCLSLCFQLGKRDDDAQRVLEEALSRRSQSSVLINHLLHLHVKYGRLSEALTLVEQSPVPVQEREALRAAVRGGCLAARENWLPARSYLEAAYQAGCRQPLCLRWYVLTLVALGYSDEAVPVLQQWQALEPRNPEVLSYVHAVSGSLDLERLASPKAEHAAAARPPIQQAPVHQPAFQQPAVQQPVVRKEFVTPPMSISAPPQVTTSQVAASQTAASQSHVSHAAHEAHGSDPNVRLLRIDSARNPADANIHFRLGEAYRTSGDEQAAEAVWRDYLRRFPDALRVRQSLCELLLRQDRAAEALELAGELFSNSNSHQAFAHFMMGIRALLSRDAATACQRLERARDAGYFGPLTMRFLAQALQQSGREADARRILANMVESHSPKIAGSLAARSVH